MQSVLDWLQSTWGQTTMSCPSKFQPLQRQYLMWCDHHECVSSHIRRTMVIRQKYHYLGSINMCQFEHEGKQRPRLHNPSKHPLWLCCQLYLLHLILLLFSLHLPLVMHIMSTNRFLSYCWYHLTIEHSSPHLQLHHINMCTNSTKRSVMEIHRELWSLL